MKTETVTVKAEDGHELQLYVAHPEGTPKAGLVVMQEIFGVNEHIRKVTEEFAADGYLAVAPAMFDRIAPGIETGYDDFQTALGNAGKLDRDNAVKDMAAAVEYARSAGKVAMIGYCWGGSMVDLAGCHSLIDAGASYYGRATLDWLDLKPTCPIIYHFGELDPLISSEMVEKISRKRDGHFRTWGGANHGFNCDSRPEYHKHSAKEARRLSLEWFDKHLGLA